MRTKLSDVLTHNHGHMVIDGSMSTGLELLGCTMTDSLWTAKILAEQPEKVKEVREKEKKGKAGGNNNA